MMKLDIIDQEYLLQVIEHDGDISPLLEKYDYIVIASALKFLLETECVKYVEKEIIITEKGRAEHDRLKMILKRKHGGWISPKTDEIISPIQEKDIYLPKNTKSLE